MKYVCLIYHNETHLATMPQAESDALPGSYVALTGGIEVRPVVDFSQPGKNAEATRYDVQARA